MVEATQAGLRNQPGIRGWLWLDRTWVGRVFAQRVLNAVLLVIAHVVADQAAKVLLIHRDDMVEDLAAAASDPSFGHSVLPRCLNARPFRLKSSGLQEGNYVGVEDRIAIQNDVAIRSCLCKSFSQLLHDPIGRWVRRDIEVQNSAAPMLNDEETVQHTERRRRHGEQVEGDDGLAVVVNGIDISETS
jgi:hypothetical protein